MAFIIVALRRIGRGTISVLFEGAFFIGLLLWDFSLVIVNTLTFKRRVGHVTPKGKPGEGGVWPEYTSPRQGDSRCSCPALNAMANHGSFCSLRHPPKLTTLRHLPSTWVLFAPFPPPPPPSRDSPPQRTEHLLPRALCPDPHNLQLFSLLLPLRTAPHRKDPQSFLQYRAL